MYANELFIVIFIYCFKTDNFFANAITLVINRVTLLLGMFLEGKKEENDSE